MFAKTLHRRSTARQVWSIRNPQPRRMLRKLSQSEGVGPLGAMLAGSPAVQQIGNPRYCSVIVRAKHPGYVTGSFPSHFPVGNAGEFAMLLSNVRPDIASLITFASPLSLQSATLTGRN